MAENGKISISLDDLKKLNSYRDLEKVIGNKHADANRIIQTIEYEHELEQLQIELLKAQQWIRETGQRVAILFEGRDAAGKGGTIRRFTQHLNPRSIRIVALPAPSSIEKGQWYFQRYIQRLPNPGEMVFFDRSWYNRAVVEPVNGFCTQVQYQQFMQQVPEFEHMLYEDGVILIKFWFSISKDEQLKRFDSRKENPLKQWKLSPVDAKAQDLWDEYSRYKEEMFNRTHTSYSPWIVVKANSKKKARNESIRHVLNTLPYPEKEHADIEIYPNPDIVTRYHRQIRQLDE